MKSSFLRIKEINSQLVDLGFSVEEILGFWADCIDEAKGQLVLDTGEKVIMSNPQ